MTTLRKTHRFLASAMLVGLMAGCASMNFDRDNEGNDSAASKEEALEFDKQVQDKPVINIAEDSKEAPTGISAVTDIRYVARKAGGTVIIESNQPPTFHTREVPERNQVVVEMANTHLPERLKRPFITTDFGQAIASVNAYQDPGTTTARVVIQYKGPTRATVTQAGSKLLVLTSTAPGIAPGQRPDDMSEIDNIAKISAQEGGPEDPRILPSGSENATDTIQFYGRPISIEVRDTSIRDVINLIAEDSGANIVLASDVDGTITLKLKQIPWDQALLIALRARNLGYIRQGSVLRIAPLATLQQEAEIARRVIETQRAAEPLKVKLIPINYAVVSDLIDRVKPFLTPTRGQVVADKRTSAIIITDTTETIERVSNLVKALDTPPLQVMIEGKVVEAGEAFERTFGIRWGFSGQETPLSGNISLQKNNFTVSPNVPVAGNGLYNFRLGTFDVFGDIDASLGLAEQESKVKIISSPRVVTLNNEPANINQGLNIFIAQPSTIVGPGGPQAGVSYTQVPVKLSLDVTPQVTNEGDIIMSIHLTDQFVADSQKSPPDIQSREATTKVMVRNGQTSVIGGIYNSNVSVSENGVPWLSSIPVLGWLFKQRDTKLQKNELLLFLTPRIVNSEKGPVKEGTL